MIELLSGAELDKARLPLVVDLDRTLLKTDTLIEQFLELLLKAPWRAVNALWRLRKGKAAFKRAVIDSAPIDANGLAINQEFLDYLKVQHKSGRPLYLVTAADQRVADAIAGSLGIFDGAVGTNSEHNLKGSNKRDYLASAFPKGFCYAGDSAVDMPIWEVAKAAIVVGVSARTRRAVEGMKCEVEAEFLGADGGIKQWLRLLRVHQWSKNILVAVPLLLSHQFFDLAALATTLSAFLAMSILASGTYVINDILDRGSDRRHRTKRFRPVASGDIDAGLAFVVAVALMVIGLAAGALISMSALSLLVAYLITTLSYSLGLKRLAMVDIFVLASLYTLRVLIGLVILDETISYWLLMFSFFFFFSLSLAKRHAEIVQASWKATGDESIVGRGYRTGDAPLTLATGVATEMVAVLVLGLYVVTDIYPESLYSHPERLWGVVSMVLIWSSRIWLLSHRGKLNDDPVSFALKDRASLVLAGLAGLAFVSAVA